MVAAAESLRGHSDRPPLSRHCVVTAAANGEFVLWTTFSPHLHTFFFSFPFQSVDTMCMIIVLNIWHWLFIQRSEPADDVRLIEAAP